MRIFCKTVGELRAELAKLPDDCVPISLEPPFDGVLLVPQNDGKVLFATQRDRHRPDCRPCSNPEA